MKTVFVDIETFGNEPELKELILPTRDDVKVGNLKDPAKIEAKIAEVLPAMKLEAMAKHDEAYEQEWRKNALKSTKLTVIVLCYSVDGQDSDGRTW